MAIPVVTVLITSYNYGPFIEQAIDSVIAQDYPADKTQIVVIDDGSTDDTSDRVSKYASRVEYFRKPNGGQASALNFGFGKARGEIVALLDADDLFVPAKLSRITEAFQADPALGMIYHRTRLWKYDSGEYLAYENFEPISGNLTLHPERFANYIPQPTTCVCFRREFLHPLLPIPEKIRMNADCFLVSLLPFLTPILALPEFLSVYRLHGKNSYLVDNQQVPREVHERHLRIWETVHTEMCHWLNNHCFTRNQAMVETFLDRWAVFLETQRFALRPPGRLRYWQYLVLENRLATPLQNWKLTLFNYLFAPMAIVLGYGRAQRFYAWRGKWMAALQFLFRGLSANPDKRL